MASTAELMREVHRLRRFARDLQEQIDRAPRQLLGQKAKLTRQEDAARDNQEAIKKTEGRGPRKGSNAQDDAHADRQVPGPAQRGRLQKGIRRPSNGDRRRAREVRRAGRGEPDGHRRDRTSALAKVAELDKTAKTAKEEFGRYEKRLPGAAGNPEKATRRDSRPS